MFITDDDFPIAGYPNGRRILRSPFSPPRLNVYMPLVLIVEDDADNRLMLRLLLEAWRYRVIEAQTEKEALRAAETEQPDAILMDVKLPLLDGFAAARRIRASPVVDGVPIIFLSGCVEDEYRRAAFAAGGNEYLVKPLDFEKLESTLGKYVSA